MVYSNLNTLGYIQLQKPFSDGKHVGLSRSVELKMERTDILYGLRDDDVTVRVLGASFFSG